MTSWLACALLDPKRPERCTIPDQEAVHEKEGMGPGLCVGHAVLRNRLIGRSGLFHDEESAPIGEAQPDISRPQERGVRRLALRQSKPGRSLPKGLSVLGVKTEAMPGLAHGHAEQEIAGKHR